MKSKVFAVMFSLLALTLIVFGLTPSVSADALRTTLTPTPTSALPDETADPLPILVWMVFDPWRMVLGSDSPRLALYDSGQIIYYSADDEMYVSAQLSEEEMTAFIDALAAEDFFALEDTYDISTWTDQPSHMIFLWRDDEMKFVYVYGDPSVDDVREALPEAFLKVYDALNEYQHPDAETWLPEYIEVMIWPYDTSDAAAWPAAWPGLDDPTTVERFEDNYSLYLPAEHFEDFVALMKEASGVALMDGRTWAVSYRFPFPQEALWREAM